MKFLGTFTLILAVAGFLGCQKKEGDGHDHAGHSHGHHHEPPHGGTGITLGNEDCHIEFLLETETGTMKAWILSAHMAGFVRIPSESFEVTAKVDGGEKALVFKAVANTATGETVGHTSMFEAQADWLKTTKAFDGVLKEVTIKGKVYSSVSFNFPKGN